MESQLLQLETLRKERQDWREEKDTLKEELEMARSVRTLPPSFPPSLSDDPSPLPF